MEDARTKVTKLWGADQLKHTEKVQDLEDKVASLKREVKVLKTEITNTQSDTKTLNSEKDTAIASALAEQKRLFDSTNATLGQIVSQMAQQLQVVLPRWGGGAREQASAARVVPVLEAPAVPEKPSFPDDIGDKDKAKTCLSN